MSVARTEIDEAVERAQQALSLSPIHALRSIRVERSGETLLLSGQVASFYHKQLAQEAILALPDQVNLINNIAVDTASTHRPR